MKKFFILGFSLFMLAMSCDDNQHTNKVWNIVESRPDSALAVLNAIDVSSLSKRELADYRLLKAMALDKNYIDVASDSLAGPAYEFFHRHGPEEKEMMSLYYLGVSQYYGKDFYEGIKTLDKAEALASQVNNTRYAGLTAMMKSYMYEALFNHVDAIRSAQEGISYLSRLPDSTLQVRRAIQQLADCHIANKNPQEACSLYKPLLEAAPADSFLQRKGLPAYAWALFLADKNNARQSYDLFQTAFEKYHVRLSLGSYCQYAAILISLGKIKEARSILQAADSQPIKAPEYTEYIRYLLQKHDGNYKDALETYESILNLQNEIALRTMEQSVIRTQRDAEAFAHKAAVEENKRIIQRNALMILSLLSVLALILYSYLKQRRRVAKEREQFIDNAREAEHQLSTLESSNDSLQNELSDIKQKYVSTYKKQFQRVSSLIENYYLTSGDKNGRDYVYRQVMELACTIGNDYESMRKLENNVNKALDNAMSKYKQEYPDRDTPHYNLVCYWMAGFPASTIELLTGIPKNTIYTKKKRLLQEIHDGNAPDRELFLLSIK